MALADGTTGDATLGASQTALPGSAERPLLAAIIVLIAARFVLAAVSDLSEDEAYYWLWSTHLASGYYDHPPMIAYWIRAGTAVFGQTAFGVRFAGLLSAIGGSYAIYYASLCLFRDRSAALLCVIWINATLLLNAAAIVATPDTPLAFFAALTLFSLARLIETGRGKWWIAVGASLGLAFVSKYTAVLLLPGILFWVMASRWARKWLLRWEPYAGALIALLIISPVFYWNYTHGWASFAKQAAHGVKDKPANALASVGEFIGGQAGLATPLIFVFCLFGSFYALVRGLKRQDSALLLLAALTAPVFVFFILHSASQKIQPNWPGFVYPAAILAAVHGFMCFRRERGTPAWVNACFAGAPWVAIAFTLIAFLQLGSGLLPIESKKDPTSRLKGWSKLGGEIASLEHTYGAASILTDRYAITGELAFYAGPPVWQIDERIRYANLPPPEEKTLQNANALLVLRQGADPSRVTAAFNSSRLLTTLVREGGIHPRDAYDIHLLSGYHGGIPGLFCAAAANRDWVCN